MQRAFEATLQVSVGGWGAGERTRMAEGSAGSACQATLVQEEGTQAWAVLMSDLDGDRCQGPMKTVDGVWAVASDIRGKAHRARNKTQESGSQACCLPQVGTRKGRAGRLALRGCGLVKAS